MFFRKKEETVYENVSGTKPALEKKERRKIAGFHDATEEGIPMIGKIVIALLLVGVLFVIWGVQNGIFSNAQNKITNFGDKMNTSTITQYENKTITGATLQAYLTETLPATDAESVLETGVIIEGEGAGTYKNITQLNSAEIGNPTKGNSKNPAYINPTKKYYCTVQRANDGTLTSVKFTNTAASGGNNP